jgi:Ca-activated chloride channel family protein
MTLDFARPWLLPLLLAVPAYLWLVRGARDHALVFSRTAVARWVRGRSAGPVAQAPGWLRAAAVIALVLALAGPRSGAAVVDVDAEGIAIMLVLDISSSMLAEDFAPRNRLVVAKQKIAEFIGSREYDRIGLVAFAGEALTQTPLTIDYPVLYQALDHVQAGVGQLEDGTAIGTAIATAANRLRHAPGESKVMVLLTDGENNRGEIDPLTAARAAAAFDIRIYTIGVGTDGVAPIPIASGPFGVQYAELPVSIDEPLLMDIARITGGQYFRATNEAALDSVYAAIDRLERSTVEVRRYVNHTPRHLPLLFIAMVALIGEWGLRASRWGRVP